MFRKPIRPVSKDANVKRLSMIDLVYRKYANFVAFISHDEVTPVFLKELKYFSLSDLLANHGRICDGHDPPVHPGRDGRRLVETAL